MQLLRLPVWIACLPLALVLTSCAGGSAPSAITPNVKAADPGTKTTGFVPATLTFVIPRPSTHGAANSRKPQYLPATAQSIEISIVLVNGSTPAPTPSPTIANVGLTALGCTTAGGAFTCTVALGLPIGGDTVLVKGFDAANATGNLLSQQQGTFTVAQGSANSFSMTLDAVPGQIVITPPASGATCSGAPLTCSVTGSSPLSFTMTVADTHGTQLANSTIAGSPVLSATSSDTTVASVTATQNPYGISLTPIGLGTATITLTASPATGTSQLIPVVLTFTVTQAAQNIYVTNFQGPNNLEIFTLAGAVSSIAGGTIGGFSHPNGVAVDAAGNIYVANFSAGNVKIFTPTGAASSIAGGTITGLSNPRGIAVDAAGNIYVANSGAGNIKIFTSTGAASSIAGGTISGLSGPQGVRVDAAGNIYVANSSANNVKIFTSTGAASSIAGGTISGLVFPCGVAVDAAGNIYVANYSANNVKIFTSTGAASSIAGGTISGLSNPEDVALDGAGNIYVANAGGNNVKIYTSTGAASSIAGGTISGLSRPVGITVH